MRGLEGTRGLDEVCLGSLLSEGPSGTFCAFPSVSPSPTPSLPRTVGLDTGGHAGEGGSMCEAGVRLQVTY